MQIKNNEKLLYEKRKSRRSFNVSVEKTQINQKRCEGMCGIEKYVSNLQVLTQHQLFCCEALSNLRNVFLICKIRTWFRSLSSSNNSVDFKCSFLQHTQFLDNQNRNALLTEILSPLVESLVLLQTHIDPVIFSQPLSS